MLSGSAAYLIFTQDFSAHCLWLLTKAGPREQIRLWSCLFVEEIKLSIRCVPAAWPHKTGAFSEILTNYMSFVFQCSHDQMLSQN